jgi:CTP-dependent riboflavin kinase
MRDVKKLSGIVDAVVELDQIWGRALVGVALLEACSATGYVTVDSLAHRLRLSNDTARRWLDWYVKEGMCAVHKSGRLRQYRIARPYAEQTMKILTAGGIV